MSTSMGLDIKVAFPLNIFTAEGDHGCFRLCFSINVFQSHPGRWPIFSRSKFRGVIYFTYDRIPLASDTGAGVRDHPWKGAPFKFIFPSPYVIKSVECVIWSVSTFKNAPILNWADAPCNKFNDCSARTLPSSRITWFLCFHNCRRCCTLILNIILN